MHRLIFWPYTCTEMHPQELKVKTAQRSSMSNSSAVNTAVQQGSKCVHGLADVSSCADRASSTVSCTLFLSVCLVHTLHGGTTLPVLCKSPRRYTLRCLDLPGVFLSVRSFLNHSALSLGTLQPMNDSHARAFPPIPTPMIALPTPSRFLRPRSWG